MSAQNVDLERAVQIAREFGAKRLMVFGSYLKNPETARDLDLAVEGVQGWKLYELAARLEEALHVALDLVSLDKPTPLTQQIEAKGRVLYEQ